MAASKPSSAADFRRHKEGEDLTLPSGLRCRAKRVGMQVLMSNGTIPNSLMPIVQKALKTGGQMKELDPGQLMAELTEEKLAEYQEAMDNIVMAIVVAPKILPVPLNTVTNEPIPDDDRDQSAAYIDWVDEMDKIYLMQYATGGTADAERFREQFAQFVVDVRPSQGMEVPAESAAGS